ncbi:MAG: hypothetical protein ACKOA8_08715 [Deltaproteobacteria bacterium]
MNKASETFNEKAQLQLKSIYYLSIFSVTLVGVFTFLIVRPVIGIVLLLLLLPGSIILGLGKYRLYRDLAILSTSNYPAKMNLRLMTLEGFSISRVGSPVPRTVYMAELYSLANTVQPELKFPVHQDCLAIFAEIEKLPEKIPVDVYGLGQGGPILVKLLDERLLWSKSR